MYWHKNCRVKILVLAVELPVIVVACALTNLPGENGLSANRWARAKKLPGEVYLPGQVIPGSRSRGGSICREKHCPGSLFAL